MHTQSCCARHKLLAGIFLQDVLDAPVGCIASDGIVDIDCNCSMHTAVQLLVDLVAAPITDDGTFIF